ncbi:biogenesis of lysosome-related organelles complex 1 subunit 4 [Phymastichus coffea]|uniref:biogenesis of lysosome-related organelles complex 1 subunit 4 n=1 Tax=Phymastichus coffea TaxID=108790 RepID=UPI00273B0756|nr:biogenesis of lysosome-related organelles complex 1 subunit 4 [Phymastichus coffea]
MEAPSESVNMSATTEAAVEEAASDYAAFATVDMDSELTGIHNAVEEMQLRLEEFTSIVGMLQTKGDKAITDNMPCFQALRPHVNNLCKRIDALDAFIAKVNVDLSTLEANMDVAESTLKPSENKLSMLNPLSLFKKSPDPPEDTSQQTDFEPITIFKADDYFKGESSKS